MVDAGGDVAGTALRLSSVAGSSLGGRVVSGDTALSGLGGDRFFARWFGMSKATWVAQPAVTRIDCRDDCGAAVVAAVARGSRLISVSGDLAIDGPASLGTNEHPVVLVTAGALSLRGAVDVHGLVFAASLSWNDAGTGASIDGAALTEGDYIGDAAAVFIHNTSSLSRLGGQQRKLRACRRQLEGFLMDFFSPAHRVLPASRAPTRSRSTQRGTTLLESLIAFVFLSLGTIATVQLEGALRQHADLARQRTEATRLGDKELESLRAYSVVDAASGVASYAGIVEAVAVVDSSSGYASNTSYRVVRHVDDGAVTGAKATSISVEWTDRNGAPQAVRLDSVIARIDPAYSGALAIAAPTRLGAFGRSSAIPLAAKPLGDGRSAWKPAAADSVALVFDDSTGQIVSRCTGIVAAMRDIVAADLAACTAGTWLLLSGTVRFTAAAPPLAAPASGAPMPFAVSVALTGTGYPTPPQCSVDAMETVRYTSNGSVHLEAVPIGALPASLGVATWDDIGDRFASYRCVVAPRADGRWSGRVTLVPMGWTIGDDSAGRRVCRFASDRDGSGAIDANIEHPADYVDVNGPLAEQNFLVIAGNQTCPASPSDSVIDAGLGTVQQQP